MKLSRLPIPPCSRASAYAYRSRGAGSAGWLRARAAAVAAAAVAAAVAAVAAAVAAVAAAVAAAAAAAASLGRQ